MKHSPLYRETDQRISKTLPPKLRELRTKHGFTQAEIAGKLGLDRSTYTYYETGKTEPPLSRLLLLSKIYNVSLDTLVGRDQEDGEGPAPSEDA